MQINVEDDISHLERLLKLGLKEENAIQFLLKNKEMELQKLVILNNSSTRQQKTSKLVNYVRKRKFEQSMMMMDNSKCRKSNSRCTYLSDEIWGSVFSYILNNDFELFKLILISKQFYRIITENKQHVLCIRSTIGKLKSFSNSKLAGNVTNLRIFQEVDEKLCKLIGKKFKLVDLVITIKKEEGDFYFSDPENFKYLESLKIRKSTEQAFQFFSRNCFNLKKLEISKIGEKDYLPHILNHTTNSISTLILKGDSEYIYPEETEWLVNPSLTSLTIIHLQMSVDVVRVIFSCKSLKYLHLNTEDVEHESIITDREHENDIYELPNLEYFAMDCRFSLLVASILKAPKIETLKLTGASFGNDMDRTKFWNNFTQFSNLKTLEMGHIRGKELALCTNFSNLTNLSATSLFIPKDVLRMDFFRNLKKLTLEFVNEGVESFFSVDHNLEKLEQLFINEWSSSDHLNCIAECRNMKNLKEFHITNQKTDNFVPKLSANECFKNLERISFPLDDNDIDHLINSPYLKNLKHVYLTIGWYNSDSLTANGLGRLSKWSQLDTIVYKKLKF